MLLTGPEIRRLAEGGVGANGERIVITPFNSESVGPNSCDVHLGDSLLEYQTFNAGGVGPWCDYHTTIDPENPPTAVECERLGEAYGKWAGAWFLRPGRVYLGSTREYTESHGLAPKLEGRSSVARLGLFVHVTAGFGDDGFNGHWTLELVATQPIIVRPGMKIAQICYTTLIGERRPYCGRYQQQPAEPVPSRFHL
jgi:dCTP deaminase